jgi:hypothetical protein
MEGFSRPGSIGGEATDSSDVEGHVMDEQQQTTESKDEEQDAEGHRILRNDEPAADDVEGHRVRLEATDEEDVEGHKIRLGTDEDDVEGHRIRLGATDEDDVEGHRFQ